VPKLSELVMIFFCEKIDEFLLYVQKKPQQQQQQQQQNENIYDPSLKPSQCLSSLLLKIIGSKFHI